MNITEILVIGFDGDSEVFAANVTEDRAKTVFIAADPGGESIVDSIREVPADALGPIVRVLEDLGIFKRPEFAAASK